MKPRCPNQGNRALTLTEVLVVICVVVVLVALFLPMLVRTSDGRRPVCLNNLKQIALAFKVWEGDHGDRYPMQVSVTNWGAMELSLTGDVAGIFCAMSNELSTPKILVCPADTGRIAATNFATDFNNGKISYFVGLDAEDKYPKMLLSGDDNLVVNGVRVRPGILNLTRNTSVEWTKERIGKLHGSNPGNVALADGSVQQTAALNFNSALMNISAATNRLVIP